MTGAPSLRPPSIALRGLREAFRRPEGPASNGRSGSKPWIERAGQVGGPDAGNRHASPEQQDPEPIRHDDSRFLAGSSGHSLFFALPQEKGLMLLDLHRIDADQYVHDFDSIHLRLLRFFRRPRRKSICERGVNWAEAWRKTTCRLVYGGGTKGIMGAVALGTSEAGGRILGIIPRFLIGKETSGPVQIPNLELVLTDDMHVRKHKMFEESDAFVALPGGIGTLEEVIEIMTWAQLGQHSKPIVFANIGGFWDPVLALLDHMKQEGFLHSLQRVRPLVVDQADQIVPAILEAAAAEEPEAGDRQVIDRL